MSEDLIADLNNELQGQLPEECIESFKRFHACKYNNDQELLEQVGWKEFQERSTRAFARVAGCKKEHQKLVACQENFFWRYIDLKNYVAEIEGRPLPYNKEDIKADLRTNYTKYNFGLNKF